ncbi:hypothetical protein ABZS66_42400 [Dactylosporangium sp. NPDC005572]|uniref:hypothetical protein n=1 Tax=Dactylosporangium sp. NPDC005572 TaxID=3156889 RepID=UPI0033B06939
MRSHTLLRGTTAVLAVLAVVQVGFAGSFLSGHYPPLRWHSLTGITMVAVALVQAVVVLLPGRRDRPRSILVGGLILPFVLAAQGALGMTRILGLHVPIGVFMVIGTLRLAAWAWGTTPNPSASKAEEVAA